MKTSNASPAHARRRSGFAFALLTLPAVACSGPTYEGFTEDEANVVRGLSPLPAVPPDPTNRYADDPKAAALGQKLFFETRYSGALSDENNCTNCGAVGAPGEKGKMGCVKCHLPDAWFTDNRSKPGNVSLGVRHTTRNSPSLVNVAHYNWYSWAGKQDSLWTQASLSPESGENSAGNRCGYAHMLWNFYRTEYNDVFGDYPLPEGLDPTSTSSASFPASCKPKKSAMDPDGAWERMPPAAQDAVNRIMANQGKAVAAYERLLVSRNAPFDRFVAGDEKAISDSAKRGLQLFIGRAFCVQCHAGPFFSDQKFHNTGAPQEGPDVPSEDEGRFADIPAAQKHAFNSHSAYSDAPGSRNPELPMLVPGDADRGAFRTKALRQVAQTAPYYHAGQFATLEAVIDFYSEGGGTAGFVGTKDARLKPLNLSTVEKADLVEFLKTLTGEPVPAHLLENPVAQ